MRSAVWMTILAMAAASALSGTRAEAGPVKFPGREVTLSGLLFAPEGRGPFPAVVALHGCSGLFEARGDLSPRFADWARRLNAQGYVVLFPDSFGSRGAGPQCRSDDRVARPYAERVDDARAAKTYLQSLPQVKPAEIALMGWSNGASTVLYAARTGREGKKDGPDFTRAIAFYPGCKTPIEKGDWRARSPLLVLIGASDDWTPAAPCRELADQAKAVGDPVSLVAYPGAYHDFDAPDLPLHTVSGLAFTAAGGGVAHTGTNPAARADAIRRVAAFLAGG